MRPTARARRLAVGLACLGALGWAGCATRAGDPSQEEDLSLLFENLYRDVHEGRALDGECTQLGEVRWCRATFEREDYVFGYERYTVITIENPLRTVVTAIFRSEFPKVVQLLFCRAEPGGLFPDRIPDYLVQSYPIERWEEFEADPLGVDPRLAVPGERISPRLESYVRGVIFHTVDEIHLLILEGEE